MLTSWDRDGSRDGYDLELLRAAAGAVSVPIIASGGANEAAHLSSALDAGASAVRILQRLLCSMGFDVSVDGQIGPQTIRATQSAAKQSPEHFADAYGIARRNYYYALADRRPASRKYARRRSGGKGGWIKRAEEFISPKYHLTDAEHRARVEDWG